MTTPTIAARQPMPVAVAGGQEYWWCACGLSKKQPFCDGSHKGSAFSPQKWTAEADATKYFCACKHTKNSPLCDGSHKAL